MNHESSDSKRRAFKTEAAKNLQLGYIESQWELVAATAWKEYLEHDRGALCLTPSAELDVDFDAIYMPLDSFDGSSLYSELIEKIENYDPTTQIVALFLTPGGYTAYCGWLPERLAPPEAYAKLKRELNWVLAPGGSFPV
jgi:hypothetical protein